jgi:hypothetical protein
VAQIGAKAEADRLALMNEVKGLTVAQETEYKERQLELDAKQFDAKLAFDREKLKADTEIKKKQIAKSNSKK